MRAYYVAICLLYDPEALVHQLVTHARGNVHTDFPAPFVFRLKPIWDKQMDKSCNAAY